MLRDVTEQLRHSRYYRNERLKARWGAAPAHVVALSVGCDIDDANNANWICQTIWIDVEMQKSGHHLGLDGNDRVENIEIRWNEQYESMKEFVEEHQGSKDEILNGLQEIKRQMILLGNQASDLFGRKQRGLISEETLIAEIRVLEGKANDFYHESGNLPFPPPDCKDFDDACQNLFATVHDLFLYYSERGLATWEQPNRDWLMLDTIKRFQDDIRQVEFEEKKIH